MDDLLQEMIDPAPAQHDRPRRRRLWTTVVVVGLAALGVTSLTTSALFSDQEKSGATIKTGSLDLKANATLDFTLPVENMLPGAQVVAPITLENTGSLAFRYATRLAAASATTGAADPTLGNGDAPGTGVLQTRLHLDLYKVDTEDDCTVATVNAPGARLIGSSNGTWGIPTAQQYIVGSNVVTSAGNRTLNATKQEVLCASVEFDETAGNTFQNTAASITLTFDAMQIPFDPANPNTKIDPR